MKDVHFLHGVCKFIGVLYIAFFGKSTPVGNPEEFFSGADSYEAFFMDVVGIPWVIPQECGG